MMDNPIVFSLYYSLANQPMPEWHGKEPSEIDMQRIRKYHEDGRFNELPREHQDWVVYRLIPSCIRYGCYPPPQNEPNIK